MKEDLLSKAECGKLLGGISESQVLRLTRTKGLPKRYLTSKLVKFDRNEVLKWKNNLPTVWIKSEKQQKHFDRQKQQAKQGKEQKET